MRAPVLCSLFLLCSCVDNNQVITRDLDPVDASGANAINIENNTGNIIVQGEAGRTTVDVEVTFKGGNEAEFDQVTALNTLDGTTVTVLLDVPSNLPNVVADIVVTLPENLATSLQALVGDVEANDLTAGANLTTDGGDVSCQDVTGGLDIFTNAGDVTINSSINTGDTIEVDIAFLGSIELTLPASTAADLNAVSGGGIISISNNLNFSGNNQDGVAVGTLNNGDGTTLIDLITASGEITLLAQ